VYALETGLFLWIIFPSWTIQQLDRLQNSEWWSVAIIGIAGSGGLGFSFNTIHHWLNLHFPILHPCMAYRELIMNLKSNGVLVLRDSRTKLKAPPEWPEKEVQAWSILSGLWHERAGKDSKIHTSNQRADSLANLVHSTGAASVAAASALITALIVVGCTGEWGPTKESVARYLLAVFLGLMVIGIHEWSYRDTVNLTRGFLEQVLADALLDEQKQPVETYVPIAPSKTTKKGGG
jgi:hypothetical protein